MMFRNLIMLAGLSALAVPIIIHLLNRRQAKLVDWGAMQFLLASLTTRKRHIMIEEIILMAIRCLLLALLVLAMARPILPSQSIVPWGLVLPAVLAAALAVGIAAAVWSMPAVRWLLLWSGLILFLIAGIAVLYEYVAQNRMWESAKGDKDVVIVLDGSTSMTMSFEGKTNFKRAVEESRSLIEGCKPGDAVALIVAGSAPQRIVDNPTSDREELKAALERVKPVGGSMDVLKALNAALGACAEGRNLGKKIVLITDRQRIGWDLRNDSSWAFLATGIESMTPRPQIICRWLDLPKKYRNLTVSNVQLSRGVIGTDRSVDIDVTVTNNGTADEAAAEVKLTVGEKELLSRRVERIPVASAESVRFEYHFPRPGPYVIKAEVLGKDAVDGDNVYLRVVNVIRRLRVLIVDGASGDRSWSCADLMAMALAPPDRSGGSSGRGGGEKSDVVVEPRVVPATRLRSAADLAAECPGLKRYGLVVLSNVPRLPKSVAERILEFVQDGGGLLIVPGDFGRHGTATTRATETFYASWKTQTHHLVAPALLTERISCPTDPARPAIKTLNHPALRVVADAARSDLADWRLRSYWKLHADEKDPSVRVAALLSTGSPLLVERQIPSARPDVKGYVLMTAAGLGLRDGNLPRLSSFLPLMHELSYFLAAPVMVGANIRPGKELTIELQPLHEGRADKLALAEAKATVITPTGQKRQAKLRLAESALRIRYQGTEQPGQYLIELPKELTGRYPALRRGAGGTDAVPFVVLGSPRESVLERLTDKDVKKCAEYVPLVEAPTFPELKAAVSGGIPGEELWQWLAIGAALALIAEIALTRWIAGQRRVHEVEDVDFGSGAEDMEQFRTRAREMLAYPSEAGATVRK